MRIILNLNGFIKEDSSLNQDHIISIDSHNPPREIIYRLMVKIAPYHLDKGSSIGKEPTDIAGIDIRFRLDFISKNDIAYYIGYII